MHPAETGEQARRKQLMGLKLRALVRDAVGSDEASAGRSGFGYGAALLSGGEAWVLVAEQAQRGLGPALAWAAQSGYPGEVGRLNVLVDDAFLGTDVAGVLARRAAAFTVPIVVWQVDGRAMHPVLPIAVAAPVAVPAEHEQLRALIVAGGAIPVDEHGVLSGEVYGLEVCRVVDGDGDGAPRLEVGVGVHDRETFSMVHGDVPTLDALTSVVDSVAAHRRPGAEPHPLNRLAPERALRFDVMAAPERVGAMTLVAAPPPVARASLKDTVPCAAVGTGPTGSLVVACSVGVDLDLVPFAVDAQLVLDPTAEVVLVLPRRDHLPVVDTLAAWAATPIRVVDWG